MGNHMSVVHDQADDEHTQSLSHDSKQGLPRPLVDHPSDFETQAGEGSRSFQHKVFVWQVRHSN